MAILMFTIFNKISLILIKTLQKTVQFKLENGDTKQV